MASLEIQETKQDTEMQHIEDPGPKWSEIKLEAERHEQYQQSLGLFPSLKIYRAAVLWSIVASFTIVQEGYDTLLLGSLFALPAFQKKFGAPSAKTKGYQVTAPWQAGLGQGANIGSFFGIWIGAYLVDHLGYKGTILGSLAFITPIIAMTTFAPNKGVLMAGEVLCGLPWGIFSTLSEAYASEVCPISLRGYLTTFVNLCWVIGHLIGAGILRKASTMTGTWSYRMPFAVQWAWPVPLFALFFFAPESPWWLVRKGKLAMAERSVRRLAPVQQKDQAKDAVSAMVRTNQLEVDVKEDTSFISCFRGTDLRRTEISMITWTIQILCGLQFANNSTYFFEQAGLKNIYAFDLTIGLYGAAFIGTCLSWWLISFAGRRTIFVTGLAFLSGGQFLIGILAVIAEKGHKGAEWGQAALMIIWLFTYDMTVGPLAYTIIGESSSTRLRNKTVGLSRMSYNVFSVTFGVLTPYMLNPTAWGWQGKIGFFWGPICLLCFVWAYFRLPEMKGRSYYEIDILFERKIAARKFSSTVVERDADEHEREALGLATH